MIVAAATANNVRLVVANDPDADRLAAAEQVMKADGSASGNFVTFSGKNVGTGVGKDVGRGAAYCAQQIKLHFASEFIVQKQQVYSGILR